jgi:hypothetical protein
VPLLDHFHPPLCLERTWEGIHNTWAVTMATQLNQDQLPPDYVALPFVAAADRNAQAQESWVSSRQASREIASSWQNDCSVYVLHQARGQQLRAVIELVSPSNKEKENDRRVFAGKCLAYLQQGVSVILVDVVTGLAADLHTHIAELLGVVEGMEWQSPSGLYALAYRPVHTDQGEQVDTWQEVLNIGSELPTLPLWLNAELCLPLRLEESYRATCIGLRIRI